MTHFLQGTPLFKGLSDGNCETIAQQLRLRQYAAKSSIFHQGDDGNCLYLVKSGQVRIFINSSDGSETSVILCGQPGQVFGELAIIDGLSRSASAVALTRTAVYTIDRDDFRHLMGQYPLVALNFMGILSRKVRYNTSQMDSLASMDIGQRLARKLLELGQDYGTAVDGGVRINTPLTQGNLASLIVATRESINKALKLFRHEGWIATQQGRIVILDTVALREQAVG